MSDSERLKLFDEWSDGYDDSIASEQGFPFAGYSMVLDEVARRADAKRDMTILDLGIGTGKLAERFVGSGCRVCGMDFSPKMLAKARARLPGVELIKADLRGEWFLEQNRSFDRIVSGYVLHEFDLDSKVRLLGKLARDHLRPSGRIIVGDICFPTKGDRERARQVWSDRWDDDEYYWAADEAVAALRKDGLRAEHCQLSECGGVLTIENEDSRANAEGE